ncbi:aminopeptidase N-like isoform X3 [Nylanderia fulva]|uniref:aminopeptidase N-like isoform X3 n=1 Tax=Nylanderia fulva TaxID=613905 RepID=UPI0010FB0F3B|nr:aminopeptidase N-like isoform X3 [Nylanderia fulva]
MRHPILATNKNILLQLTKMEDWALEKHCPLIKVERYYRVNYDEQNWQRISTYLKSDNYTKIHVLNRAQIIDDAFNLMITGELTGVVFWNVILYLQKEEDYIPWYPMFKALEYLSSTFIMLKEQIKNFTSEVRQILHEILKRIKYEEIDDTDKLRICLRQEAARWACFFGDITCKKVANNKLTQHLQDPAKYKLLPWWKEWTYCKGLMITTINNTTWELVYTKGLNKSDSKFLKYLACPENINLIKNI